MNASFVENWHSTARKFHEAVNAGRKVQIIDIQEAWKRYLPVSLFAENFDIDLKPVKNDVESELRSLKDVTNGQYKKEIANLNSLKKKDIADPAKLKNRIGLLYVRSGDYQKALKFFKQAYNINKSSKMLSNYAGTLLLSGREKEALKIFDKIYKEDNSGAIAINRALCKYIVSGDSSSIQNFFDCLLEAVSVVRTDDNLSELLGFDISGRDSLRGSNRSKSNAIPKLDISILRQSIKAIINIVEEKRISGITTESSSGSRITGTTTETSTGTTADNITKDISPFGGLRGAAIEDFIRLIDLLYWFDF
jgi:tetratricopeptide (TPR) repeat protein